MTTVAYANGIIATDSQITRGDTIEFGRKLFKVNGTIIALTGDVYAGRRFVQWYKTADEDAQFSDGDDFECLLLSKKGLFTIDRRLTPIKVRLYRGGFFAIGSGSGFALGALRNGADAVQAIKTACEFDVSTSGKVQSARL